MKAVIPFLLALALLAGQAQETPLREPDVHYVPTPQAVVDAMLKMAAVTGRMSSTTSAAATDGFRSPRPNATARAASASTSTRGGSPKPPRTPRRPASPTR